MDILTPAMDKRMSQLEIKFDYMSEKVENLEKIMTAFIEKADERYSAKWAETALKWVVTLVMSVVITSLIALVIVK